MGCFNRQFLILVSVVLLVLSGCASHDPYRRAKAGAAVGAVTGAVIGHQVNHDAGRYIGAVGGALAGGAAGYYLDRQQQEFERELQAERDAHAMQIERVRDDMLKLTLDSEVSFDFDRADIKPSFRQSLDKLATIINKYDRTEVQVVGHTDSLGPADYNMDLSRRRAARVSDYLVMRGVAADRLDTAGRGESEPRDSNTTADGRQLNRRVELFITPRVTDS
jgi:outer membrane protein OmpA-like peptidoglycan-associated protein